MSEPVYCRATDLLEAEVGDELVALDAEQGTCFGFNSVATSVWRALREPRSFDALRDALLEEYSVTPEQCTSDLRDLLGEMEHRGLIRPTS